ncbi:Na+/H+ antiporter subunit G [Pseudahrensia aquimaris]|uniref:Na+/H+ antiporter subunit G n=1 Tax=Pseudahrensia aquimaris TaxID=744461 RepID=A0ABW3FGD4_9HYPH
MMEIAALYFISFCLLVGACFIAIGAIGLLRFDDAMARLHAPTKVGTLGVGALLIASMLHSDLFGEGWSMHEVLIMAFLFVTAPISANFMAKVTIHAKACEAPPKPSEQSKWSTLDVPEEDLEVAEQKV